ncbi:WS/DGAT domain-containing protein [Micromonospora coerulea]|uniref:WS/DGAT domain-containing protein n=1 Tax=Micromonospora coerulea TaxID=47856 RepID=UPI003D154D1F
MAGPTAIWRSSVGSTSAIRSRFDSRKNRASAQLPIMQSGVVQRAAWRSMGRQRVTNLSVSNVPGPPRRLHLATAAVLELFPITMIFGNLTLGVAALSYAGLFTITAVADRGTCPDVENFTSGIPHSMRSRHRPTRHREADQPPYDQVLPVLRASPCLRIRPSRPVQRPPLRRRLLLDRAIRLPVVALPAGAVLTILPVLRASPLSALSLCRSRDSLLGSTGHDRGALRGSPGRLGPGPSRSAAGLGDPAEAPDRHVVDAEHVDRLAGPGGHAPSKQGICRRRAAWHSSEWSGAPKLSQAGRWAATQAMAARTTATRPTSLGDRA